MTTTCVPSRDRASHAESYGITPAQYDRTPVLAPFAAMTPLDQALHLVYDHGFGRDHFAAVPDGHPFATRIATDDQVVQAFVSTPFADLEPLSDGYSFPCTEGRADWHDGDHEEHPAGDGCVEGPHVHTELRILTDDQEWNPGEWMVMVKDPSLCVPGAAIYEGEDHYCLYGPTREAVLAVAQQQVADGTAAAHFQQVRVQFGETA